MFTQCLCGVPTLKITCRGKTFYLGRQMFFAPHVAISLSRMRSLQNVGALILWGKFVYIFLSAKLPFPLLLLLQESVCLDGCLGS